MLEDYKDSDVLDVALIGSGKAIEHYEMARYSALKILPEKLCMSKAATSITTDMFEIPSSKLDEQKSNGATKAFAKKMIPDQTKTSQQLKRLVNSGKVKATIPISLDIRR